MSVNILDAQKLPGREQIKYDESKTLPRFDFEQFPVGYFSDNKRGKALRKQLIVDFIYVTVAIIIIIY